LGIILYGLINPTWKSYLRKEKLLGDSLCGAQTPQRVNGSVQLCFVFIIYIINVTLNWIVKIYFNYLFVCNSR
jgi:hypothetical protein